MRQSQPLAFYFFYHIIMSFVLMNIVAQIIVAYNWYLNIFLSTGILFLFSFGSYGLISRKFIRHPINHTRFHLLALLLFMAILCSYGTYYFLFDFLIVITGITQCLIIAAIEWFGGASSEKAKRSL